MAAYPFHGIHDHHLNDLRQFPPLPASLIIAYPKQQQHPKNNHHQDGDNPPSPIHNLNDILLELIFTRLVQWRHVVTCKCVSKRWNSIISNPYFTRYLNTKYSPFTLILRLPGGETWAGNCLITEHPYFQTHNLCLDDIIPIPNNINNNNNNNNNNYNNYFNYNPSPTINIHASHDDILLILCRRPFYVHDTYYIANPLTKQFIIVPITSDEPPYNYSFDSFAVGFAGFVSGVSTIDVPNSMGFRIIRINTPDPNLLICQIYSSETGKWTTYTVNNLGFELRSENIFDGRNQALTCNNKVHWRGQANKILVIDPFVDRIESHCVLDLPSEIHEGSVLESCRNQLRISQFDDIGPRIKIWEFDDYDNVMITLGGKLRLVIDFTLKPNLIDSVFSRIGGLFSLRNEVICCHPNDPDIVYIMFRDKLLQCDVIKSRLKVIRHCCRINWSERFMLFHPLMAS